MDDYINLPFLGEPSDWEGVSEFQSGLRMKADAACTALRAALGGPNNG